MIHINPDIEKSFADRFIVRDKRKRLLFELSGRKRRDGIARFCHGAGSLLMESRVVLSGSALYYDEILEYIREHEKTGRCYIMAYNEALDGTECDVEDGLKQILGNGMAAVLIAGNTAVVETEQCYGTPMRYVMHI